MQRYIWRKYSTKNTKESYTCCDVNTDDDYAINLYIYNNTKGYLTTITTYNGLTLGGDYEYTPTTDENTIKPGESLTLQGLGVNENTVYLSLGFKGAGYIKYEFRSYGPTGPINIKNFPEEQAKHNLHVVACQQPTQGGFLGIIKEHGGCVKVT